MSPRGEADPARNFATAIAVFGLLLLSGGLLALVALVLPQALGVLIVVFGFGWLATFHYVVWGRLLTKRVEAEREAAARQEREALPPPHDSAS